MSPQTTSTGRGRKTAANDTSEPVEQTDPPLPAPRASEPTAAEQCSLEKELRSKIEALGLKAVEYRSEAKDTGAVMVFDARPTEDEPEPRAFVYWVPPSDMALEAKADADKARQLNDIDGTMLDLIRILLDGTTPSAYRITPYFGSMHMVVQRATTANGTAKDATTATP